MTNNNMNNKRLRSFVGYGLVIVSLAAVLIILLVACGAPASRQATAPVSAPEARICVKTVNKVATRVPDSECRRGRQGVWWYGSDLDSGDYTAMGTKPDDDYRPRR